MPTPAGFVLAASKCSAYVRPICSISLFKLPLHIPTRTYTTAGFVLAASNTLAGVLSDATRTAGLGNVGCFAGGATACALASLLLLAFDKWVGLLVGMCM